MRWAVAPLFLLLPLGLFACGPSGSCSMEPSPPKETPPDPAPSYSIDLSHWKLTLPTGRRGNPDELLPRALEEALAEDRLRPYLYRDEDGALRFFVTPAGGTTPNSPYPRTELREQIVPGQDRPNWRLVEGGTLRARLALNAVSVDDAHRPHKVILAQIHAKDGPPLLKIVWRNGRIEARLKRRNPDHPPNTRAGWEDRPPFVFDREINHLPFTLDVVARDTQIRVRVEDEEAVFEDPDLSEWTFGNYFKAGTYLLATEAGAFAHATFWRLEVTHP